MSNSQAVSGGASDALAKSQPADPLKNPSYPQRTHLAERAHWQEVLRSCEDKIARARTKLDGSSPGPGRAGLERMYAQMLGARDQVADAVRRLPMETGDLYTEDRHRLEEAVAALERVLSRWEGQPAD